MKIVKNNKHTKFEFCIISKGDVFMFNGIIYMKT